MTMNTRCFLLLTLTAALAAAEAPVNPLDAKNVELNQARADIYPAADSLKPSPGNTTYRVDPDKGEDLGKINAIRLAPGDKVVIAPGVHHESLAPHAAGTAERPVTIHFAPGRHEFRADRAIQLCYFVSNSADAPLNPRPVGIFVKGCRHLRITGAEGQQVVRSICRATLGSGGPGCSKLRKIRGNSSSGNQAPPADCLEVGPCLRLQDGRTFRADRGRDGACFRA